MSTQGGRARGGQSPARDGLHFPAAPGCVTAANFHVDPRSGGSLTVWGLGFHGDWPQQCWQGM